MYSHFATFGTGWGEQFALPLAKLVAYPRQTAPTPLAVAVANFSSSRYQRGRCAKIKRSHDRSTNYKIHRQAAGLVYRRIYIDRGRAEAEQRLFRDYFAENLTYPEYKFVKTLAYPDDAQRKKYKRAQEIAPKDIERSFGVLKKRFAILAKSSLFTKKSTMMKVMFTCMILHNMILEDEGHAICQYDENEIILPPQPLPVASPEYLQRVHIVRSREIHGDLRRHLVDHLWTVDHLDLNMDPVDEYDALSLACGPDSKFDSHGDSPVKNIGDNPQS
ncbi:hypothetical protein LXL04_009790 [Taraxacum kok-saghyz]